MTMMRTYPSRWLALFRFVVGGGVGRGRRREDCRRGSGGVVGRSVIVFKLPMYFYKFILKKFNRYGWNIHDVGGKGCNGFDEYDGTAFTAGLIQCLDIFHPHRVYQTFLGFPKPVKSVHSSNDIGWKSSLFGSSRSGDVDLPGIFQFDDTLTISKINGPLL